jgi:hypothetical protein
MINPEQKAVGHTQDWSDPKQALAEIEQATAAAEELEKGNDWFDRLVKRPAETAPAAATADEPPAARRGRGRRRGG